jgi:hypothetical protein
VWLASIDTDNVVGPGDRAIVALLI